MTASPCESCERCTKEAGCQLWREWFAREWDETVAAIRRALARDNYNQWYYAIARAQAAQLAEQRKQTVLLVSDRSSWRPLCIGTTWEGCAAALGVPLTELDRLRVEAISPREQ